MQLLADVQEHVSPLPRLHEFEVEHESSSNVWTIAGKDSDIKFSLIHWSKNAKSLVVPAAAAKNGISVSSKSWKIKTISVEPETSQVEIPIAFFWSTSTSHPSAKMMSGRPNDLCWPLLSRYSHFTLTWHSFPFAHLFFSRYPSQGRIFVRPPLSKSPAIWYGSRVSVCPRRSLIDMRTGAFTFLPPQRIEIPWGYWAGHTATIPAGSEPLRRTYILENGAPPASTSCNSRLAAIGTWADTKERTPRAIKTEEMRTNMVSFVVVSGIGENVLDNICWRLRWEIRMKDGEVTGVWMRWWVNDDIWRLRTS